MKLALFSYYRSSSAWRVRIALALKQLPYEYVTVHLGQGEQYRAEFVARNPQAMVPVLEIDEDRAPRVLTQSLAIIEYLEERVPQPSLFPADPYLRARARQLAEIVNSGIQPFQNLAVLKRIAGELGADEKAWARGFIERGLDAYDKAAADVAGRFSVGDAPTVADCCLVPQLYSARRFGADVGPFARLLAIEAACAELPAFRAAHADAQPDAPAS